MRADAPWTADAAPQQAVVDLAESFFAHRGWTPFEFQRRAWSAYRAGQSGLIHAPTGLGKTFAAWMGPLCDNAPTMETDPVSSCGRPTGRELAEPLRVLWLTPLRALATDTCESLLEPVRELDLPWTVELRTSDTPRSLRLKQRERLPSCLVTTPESLSVLLSYPGTREKLATLRCVICDEWHELMGSKRGVQVELALARLRVWNPALRTWGMSATLGNLDEAMDTLLGVEPLPRATSDDTSSPHSPPAALPLARRGELIQAQARKRVRVTTLLPDDPERFTWAGHLGLRLARTVLDSVEHSEAQSTLLFTNTRSQAEIWFKRFLEERPDLLGHVAIHHGSLDKDIRRRVEAMLDEGRLRCVVCTSSLDLGIDFRPVDQVIQLGSPKGIGRLLQRAGRSGHRPGAESVVLGVPTNAFELVEFAAAREAIEAAQQTETAPASTVESRRPLDRPIDVLVQHLVTCASGDGFTEADLRREVASTVAFRRLSDQEWTWAMDFVARGGNALKAYDHFARIKPDELGVYHAASERLARQHRLTIGTINSGAMMSVKYTSGKLVGTIEESFISRLEVGARFILAGRVLELARVREMTAWVRRAPTKSGIVPKWEGGRMSLSTQLAGGVRRKLDEARRGEYLGPEMLCAKPLLELQMRWSALPEPGEVLIEHVTPPSVRGGPTDDEAWDIVDPVTSARTGVAPGDRSPGSPRSELGTQRGVHRGRTREARNQTGWGPHGGHHAFLYLFDGRLIHEGLGVLLSHRLTRLRPLTVVSTATDQGLSLASVDPLRLDEPTWRALLNPDHLLDDLLACVNTSALARRQFRDIARVAGLIVPGFPGARGGARIPMRHLQASSEMFFDVFEQFDRGNLLLDQARREVLDAQLEVGRLRAALERASASRLRIVNLDRLTPLAFPIWAETIRATQASSEKWSDLVSKMSMRLEAAASDEPRVNG